MCQPCDKELHRHLFRILYKNPILYELTVKGFYHDGGRPPLLFYRLRGICQKCRVNAGAGAGGLVAYCAFGGVDLPAARISTTRSRFLGQRLSWVSKPVARAFGHRGFTHSLLAVFGALALFYLKVPESWIVPADALQGLVLGYLSHITRRYAHPGRRAAAVALPLAVPPADPRAAQRQSARARAVHGAVRLRRLDAADAWPDNSAVRWSSNMINSLQITFNRFIDHQAER